MRDPHISRASMIAMATLWDSLSYDAREWAAHNGYAIHRSEPDKLYYLAGIDGKPVSALCLTEEGAIMDAYAQATPEEGDY